MTKEQLKALESITEGKWSIDGVRHYFEGENGPLVVDQHGRWIAIACTDAFMVGLERKEISPEEQKANAQAIACLPDLIAEREEMIAALRECIAVLSKSDTLRHLCPDFPALDNALKILAEAEGVE